MSDGPTGTWSIHAQHARDSQFLVGDLQKLGSVLRGFVDLCPPPGPEMKIKILMISCFLAHVRLVCFFRWFAGSIGQEPAQIHRRRTCTYVPGYSNLHVQTEQKTHGFCVGNPRYFKQQHTASTAHRHHYGTRKSRGTAAKRSRNYA